MASWSTKHKSVYFSAFVAFVVFVIALPAFLFFYKSPTCSDGKKNGSEKGIDCGGSCIRLCPADFGTPHILWSYSMDIAPGVYNSLAYVENPNQSVEVGSLDYVFKLYDDRGLLVAEKKGETFVPAGRKFAVFAGGVRTGERVPVKTTFEFNENIEWQKGNVPSSVRVLNINLDQESEPKAEAKIINDSVGKTYASLNAFIILYDENDNRLAFSKTLIDKIAPGETKVIYFTWPKAFLRKAFRSEIIFVAQ
ncbi:MAG: hypothetical protein AAB484_01085 [Patescibacteria group bacterium]